MCTPSCLQPKWILFIFSKLLQIKEEKVRNIFAAHGELTDLKMKYTAAGVFRKFAFVGFRAKESAKKAIEHLNKTFIDSSKIQVGKNMCCL